MQMFTQYFQPKLRKIEVKILAAQHREAMCARDIWHPYDSILEVKCQSHRIPRGPDLSVYVK